MNNNVLSIGVNNWWKGYQMIILDEVPSEIPSTLMNILLARCQKLGVSIELCVFSGEDKQRLTVAFILRCEGNSRYNVQGMLNDLSQSLLPQFADSGFTAHLAEDSDPACLHMEQFFGGVQSRRNIGKGFFPEDKLLGSNQFYIPGKYTSESLLPISWEQLARVLTRYPMSMMCIQLTNTSLTPAEHQYLVDCKKYFAGLNTQHPSVSEKDQQAVGEARMTYDQLLELADKPLFFVSCFCVGSTLFTDDMIALMRTWQYRVFTLEPQMLQQGNYLFFGDRMAKTEIYGHMERCIRRFQPNPRFQRLTHLITPQNAAALFPLPSQTASIPGLDIRRALSTPVLVPEGSVFQENKKMIYLGKQEGTNVRFGISLGDLRRHGFIVGKSGCGKTTFAMGLLHQLYKLDIPFLVVEPAKCEYRSLLSVIKDLKIYTPGLSGVSPIQLNPFMPPKGVTLEEYLPTLATIFNAAISMDHPLDVLIPQVIRICYNQHGWRPTSTRDSKGVQPFGMTEFIRCYQDYIRKNFAEDQESRSNLEAGGAVRLMQLISEYPHLFDTNNTIDFTELFAHPTIIELDSINNDQQRSLIMMTILMQAKLAVKKSSVMDSPLKHIIMIDEAHLLLGSNEGPSTDSKLNSSSHCIRELQDTIKIFRSYGTGVFFGDQNPEKLTRDIMEHVNLKLMFQQDSPNNRAVLAALTRMDDTMQDDLIDLHPGQGYVFLDKNLNKPAKIYTPNYKQELTLRNDITDEEVTQLMRTTLTPPFRQCTTCESCANRCNPALRKDAKFIAEHLLSSNTFSALLAKPDNSSAGSSSVLSGLVSTEPQDNTNAAKEQKKRLLSYLNERFASDVASYLDKQDINWPNLQQLQDCVKIQLVRSLMLNSACMLSLQDLHTLLEAEKADLPQAQSPAKCPPERKLGTKAAKQTGEESLTTSRVVAAFAPAKDEPDIKTPFSTDETGAASKAP